MNNHGINKKWLGIFFAAIIIITSVAFAEESGSEAHESGIPRIVFYQALNFFGLIVILFYLTKSKVKDFYFQRHKTLTAALTEAKRIREEAEKKHQEYTIKIQDLEKQADAVIEKIRLEGEQAKNRMIAEAKTLAQAIDLEAKRTASNEIEKAKAELYDEVLQQALDGARGILEKSIAANDQKRLQREFVDKIEAVQ